MEQTGYERTGGLDAAQARVGDLMEQASRDLLDRAYFDTIDRCMEALEACFVANDFALAARVCMPLQEARRQIRQLAVDAGSEREVRVVSKPPGGSVEPGCYLFQPPAIGMDASVFRQRAHAERVPVFVLCREPTPRKGRWEGLVPLVGVGPISVRAYVEPEADDDGPPSLAWFESAGEALGDAGIASVPADDPAAWQVQDLWERLAAVPEHEKLHQRLSEACRAAFLEPLPEFPRRQGLDDPYSF